jgi:prolyl oligopeptidase
VPTLQPPEAPRSGQTDTYHGEVVADPYRWLEDSASDATRSWVAAQCQVTEEVLSALGGRDHLRDRLRRAWDHQRRQVPVGRGTRWFQERNTGLQDQDVLYVMDAPGDEGSVLLDPNAFSDAGTVSVPSFALSPQGNLLAYATSESGSDWMTWHVRDVAGGRDRDDILSWSKFGNAAWASDESGFYYPMAPPPPAGQELTASNAPVRIAYHRLGTPQRDDVVVYEPPRPDWMADAEVTEDGRYLVVTVRVGTGTETRVEVLDLEQPDAGMSVLVEGFTCRAEVVCRAGGAFLVMTDAGAPRGRLVRVQPGAAGPDEWEEVVGEKPGLLLGARNCGGRLLCHYLVDACSAVHVHGMDGALLDELVLPELSSLSQRYSAAGAEGREGSDVAHFKLSSFTSPGQVWAYDVSTGVLVPAQSPQTGPGLAHAVPGGGPPSAPAAVRVAAGGLAGASRDLVTEQVFVEVEGIGRVPVFLVHRRDVHPDGDVPVLLWGYGGFNIPVTPAYSPWTAVFAELGGLLAVAVLPGGGEYGREWYEAGRLANKQNVFTSFCECARWLVSSGWSRPSRIAMNGGSNGGLLVGACLTQQPELFGAAVPEVGVLDMLRYHLFTIGWAWKSDYGDPADPVQYRWLRAYSPLHNVDPGATHPHVMVVTADHDDRVVPAHSFKFAAEMQHACRGGKAKVLLRVERSAGHGHGIPTGKLIDERADVLAFLDWAVGPLDRGARP